METLTSCFSAAPGNCCSRAAGVSKSRVSGGWWFKSIATYSKSVSVRILRSVDFEKYCRSSPLVFSLLPRCHGEPEPQKHTGSQWQSKRIYAGPSCRLVPRPMTPVRAAGIYQRLKRVYCLLQQVHSRYEKAVGAHDGCCVLPVCR